MTIFTERSNGVLGSPTPQNYNEIPSPFAMSDSHFRELALRVITEGAHYLQTLGQSPVYQTMPPEERQLLRSLTLPVEGSTPEDILDFIQKHIQPYGRNQNDPLFAAFVDPATTKMAILAMMIAIIMNNSGSGGDYSLIYVEEIAVRWLAELVGFPTGDSDGVLLGGGSDANRHGIEVGRFWAAKKYGWNVREEGLSGYPRLKVYGTDERHSCIDKACFTLGLGAPQTIATDEHSRMDLASLRKTVEADRAAGNLPAIVVATAGTVTTGAIDPLDTLADFCEEQGLWLHVDGAFGGLGAADPQLRALYKGLERAHSLALDPHKWLGVPVGCSCVLVRLGSLLLETYRLVPSYLRFQTGKGFAGDRWYSHRSAEQTRPTSRALTVFANIMQGGRSGVIAHVRRHIELAEYLRSMVQAFPTLELLAGGPLPVVCFRVVPEILQGKERAIINRFNQAVVERLQTEGVAFLGGVDLPTPSGEVYALRYCNLNYQLTQEHIEIIVGEVVRVAELCQREGQL